MQDIVATYALLQTDTNSNEICRPTRKLLSNSFFHTFMSERGREEASRKKKSLCFCSRQPEECYKANKNLKRFQMACATFNNSLPLCPLRWGKVCFFGRPTAKRALVTYPPNAQNKANFSGLVSRPQFLLVIMETNKIIRFWKIHEIIYHVIINT